MRDSRRCPKCTCARLYVVPEVRQPNLESANGVHTVNVTASNVPATQLGLDDEEHGNRHRTLAGTFEAWICSRCGFTEWYARDVAGILERLARIAGSGVVVVDQAPTTPFRG